MEQESLVRGKQDLEGGCQEAKFCRGMLFLGSTDCFIESAVLAKLSKLTDLENCASIGWKSPCTFRTRGFSWQIVETQVCHCCWCNNPKATHELFNGEKPVSVQFPAYETNKSF
uniref:Uncharacterized protein n=1 Tax=Physcomitrium patens TaxID=3218 RepID=A0A2K1IMG8_PHYPA|nr:hypothetical protein PHYPA_026791 [Physcomitrium patens]